MGDIKLINLKDRLINLFCDISEDSCKEVIEKIQEIT